MSDTFITFRTKRDMEVFIAEARDLIANGSLGSKFLIKDNAGVLFEVTKSYNSGDLNFGVSIPGSYTEFKFYSDDMYTIRPYPTITDAYVVIDSAVAYGNSSTPNQIRSIGSTFSWDHTLPRGYTEPAATTTRCQHQYVNISFSGITMACKHCGENRS